jgi:diadenosine tetraphosphate (Ap4A) HIT family hydrolase
MPQWPDDWAEKVSGIDCGFCASSGAEENPHGVRILDGRWSDAFLGRFPVRAGYAYIVWKGRHVCEPTELSPDEAAGFWAEVARVADAVEKHYRPAKMNWLHLGNGVPHLHVHLIPRPYDDPAPGGPLEQNAFERSRDHEIEPAELDRQAELLRQALGSH